MKPPAPPPPVPLRLLVFGGRDYTSVAVLRRALDMVRNRHPIALVIHGDAGQVDKETGEVLCGADKLGGDWAKDRGIAVQAFPVTPAEWRAHGPYAGPRRNAQMMAEGRPTHAVGFPRADGTLGAGSRDMAARLHSAGIPIWWPVRLRARAAA